MNDYILFDYSPNKSDVYGFFDEDDGQIYISKKLSKILRELIFVHEAQHRDCFNSKCKCWKKETDFWSEYHAFRAEFYFVLNKNSRKHWIAYFEITIKQLIKYKNNKVRSYKSHFQALRKVCRFKKFQEFAKKYGYWKKISKLLNEY